MQAAAARQLSAAVLTLAVLLSPAPAASQATAPAPHAHGRVVLITIDGLPARALDDPRLPMPTLRELARSGVISKGMVPINPTVTWPNHTTLITGVDASVHHVMANGLLVFPFDGTAPVVKPWVPKDELVHAPTLYDAAAQAGLTTGQVDWVAIYGAKNVQYQFGERPDSTGEVAQNLVRAGLVTQGQIQHFSEGSSPAWRDEIWTDAAIDILKQHAPDLLLVHLLETDSLQHEYGPLTPAAYAAYAFADTCVKRIVDAVHDQGLSNNTTFIVTADHGFATYTHTIRPNVLLVQRGLLTGAGRQLHGSIWAQAEGGAAMVFAPHLQPGSAQARQLRSAFAALPGVEHVAMGEDLRALGLPVEGSTDQAPLLYLTAAPGYAFSGDAKGALEDTIPPQGQHGYSRTNPQMQAIFIASGAGIRSGLTLPVFNNLAVAPTIAKLLGIALPTAVAPPLTEALK